jgi:hypothetical protein
MLAPKVPTQILVVPSWAVKLKRLEEEMLSLDMEDAA